MNNSNEQMLDEEFDVAVGDKVKVEIWLTPECIAYYDDIAYKEKLAAEDLIAMNAEMDFLESEKLIGVHLNE